MLLGIAAACTGGSPSNAPPVHEAASSNVAAEPTATALQSAEPAPMPSTALTASTALPASTASSQAPVADKVPTDLAARITKAFSSVRLACKPADTSYTHHPEVVGDTVQLPCWASADIDLDGAMDDVALVLGAKDELGIAVVTRSKGTILIGAGTRGPMWRVEIDGQSSMKPVERDLQWLRVWKVVLPVSGGGGFASKAGMHEAEGVRGDGLYLSGGDAAAIAYFDGKGWRLLHLGF